MKTIFLMLMAAAHCLADEPPSTVEMQQYESPCRLHDFEDRPDGFIRGTKTWIGNSALLRCSFYVSQNDFYDGRNTLSGGGTCHLGEHGNAMHASYFVAFFDSAGNLIACDGNTPAKISPGTITSITRTMPLPKMLHQEISQYKLNYIESEAEIGTIPLNKNNDITLRKRDRITGKIVSRQWPRWRVGGEINSPSTQKEVSSLNLITTNTSTFNAYTSEGSIQINKENSHLLKSVGNSKEVNAEFRAEHALEGGKANAVKTWIRIDNFSQKPMFAMLYISFFDKSGNLVCCCCLDSEVAKDAAIPEFTIDGQLRASPNSFQGISMVVPTGAESLINSYKATIYYSEHAIGSK